MDTLFWHDYETFGVDPRRDRPCQFAGLRTDHDLNVVGDPVQWYCQPTADFLPDPMSCAITGISPQHAMRHGLLEAEFCAQIQGELAEPGTCGVGYNSLRFDDEITRNMLYRNFHEPYEREWKQGNSRWDLLDVLRMTQALRPEGIVWPQHEDGSPSFKLEALAMANGIEHSNAHDALADVYATLELARLVKTKQPKLYDWLFQLRNKNRVLPLLDLVKQEPVLHVSRMYSANRGCLAVVLPLCRHPSNSNGIVVADLLEEPQHWMQLGANELIERLFRRKEERQEGEARIPLKTVHINRCPALAPLNVLTPAIMQRLHVDLALVQQRRDQLVAVHDLAQRVQQVFRESDIGRPTDPDLMLYGGGFLGDHDKRVMQRIRQANPSLLAAITAELRDPRLPELLFRYRARNYPHTLSMQEQQDWRDHCRRRLAGELPGAGVSLQEFKDGLEKHAAELAPTLQEQLLAYGKELAQHCGLSWSNPV